MRKELIAAATAAKTIHADLTRGSFPKTVIVYGDMAANTIAVKNVAPDGTIVANFAKSGTAFAFSATITVLDIPGPCHIAIVKGTTTNAVGVSLFEQG